MAGPDCGCAEMETYVAAIRFPRFDAFNLQLLLVWGVTIFLLLYVSWLLARKAIEWRRNSKK